MLLDYNVHIELFLTYRKCYVSRMMYLCRKRNKNALWKLGKKKKIRMTGGEIMERGEGERSNNHKIIYFYFSHAWDIHLYMYLLHHYQKQAIAILSLETC